MAANKRNAGLTSAIPRASLNDEELVNLELKNGNFFLIYESFLYWEYFFHSENTCLQENITGIDLSDFQYNTT